MLDIIQDLIDISHLTTGQIELKTEITDISELLEELLICFQAEADKKGIAFRYNIELPQNKNFVRTDRVKLTQVLSNLIKNALGFTVEGSVEFGCELKKDNSLFFYVQDTGIGIRKEHLEQIFEPFRQGEVSTFMVQEGIGLGLAISKAYVELLGGTIIVNSAYMKGSLFSFTIPFDETAGAEKPSKDKDEKTTALLANPNVLVAEDEETNYLFLQEILRLNNINAYHARDGLEAIEAIKTNPDIHLILMDIKMPRMGGIEATKQIKILRPEIPIIVQSAYCSEEDKQKAYEAGCDDFVAKPIEKTGLLKKIALHVNYKTDSV